MLTALSFLVMLSVIVVVHEYGHYKVAVLCGVRVIKFSVGFGKPLFAWQLHPFRRVNPVTSSSSSSNLNTENTSTDREGSTKRANLLPDTAKTIFLISAIPLGGYVQMLDEREGSVPLDQTQFAFNQKSLKARAAIVVAGPVANFLLAILLYASIQWVGQMQPTAVLGQPLPGSIASLADLQSGDRIIGLRPLGEDVEFLPTPTYKEFVDALVEVKIQLQNNQKATESISAGQPLTNSPQWVELSIHKEGTKGRSPDISGAPGLEKSVDLSEIMSTRPTHTLKIDLSQWHLSEHVQDSPKELFLALKDLGLTGPRRAAVINSVLDEGVAKKAGLLAGDEVLRVNGASVSDAQELVHLIHKSVDGQRESEAADSKNDSIWEIKRNFGGKDTQINVVVKPRVIEENGKPIGRVDAIIGGNQELVFKRLGIWGGIAFASRLTLDQALMSLSSFKSMVLGQLSWRELSGPLTLAEYAGKTAQVGWASFVGFVAFVSVSIGVLNLMPIPVLDGGQLMYYLWELLSGSAPSEVWNARLTRFGLATVLLMMGAAVFNDILRLIG